MKWLLGLLGFVAVAEISAAESRGFRNGTSDSRNTISDLESSLSLATARAVAAERKVIEQADAAVVLAALKVVAAVLRGESPANIGTLQNELARRQLEAMSMRQQYCGSQQIAGYSPAQLGGAFGGLFR